MQISSEKISAEYLEINSCNVQHLTGKNYRMLRPEGRVDYHILYIISGACHVIEGGEDAAVGAGGMVLYLPHERQEYCYRAEEDTTVVFVHFSGTGVPSLLASCGFTERVTYLSDSGRLSRVLYDMVEEVQLKKPFFALNAATRFVEFLSLGAREVAYRTRAVSSAARRGIDSVLRQMHRQFEKNYTVAELAEMVHLSEGRFAHLFKECTGMSPKRYLLQLKVDAACHLLATTTMSVSEVAEEVGIDDVNYFSRLIKKYTGYSPRKQR